jgi:hypothetical protein
MSTLDVREADAITMFCSTVALPAVARHVDVAWPSMPATVSVHVILVGVHAALLSSFERSSELVPVGSTCTAARVMQGLLLAKVETADPVSFSQVTELALVTVMVSPPEPVHVGETREVRARSLDAESADSVKKTPRVRLTAWEPWTSLASENLTDVGRGRAPDRF